MFLIFKNSTHRIVTDPSDETMNGAEVLCRCLNVSCRANVVFLKMMEFAKMDILSRLADEEMLPDRVRIFNEKSLAFSECVPSALKIYWQSCQVQGLTALTSQKAIPEIG